MLIFFFFIIHFGLHFAFVEVDEMSGVEECLMYASKKICFPAGEILFDILTMRMAAVNWFEANRALLQNGAALRWR